MFLSFSGLTWTILMMAGAILGPDKLVCDSRCFQVPLGRLDKYSISTHQLSEGLEWCNDYCLRDTGRPGHSQYLECWKISVTPDHKFRRNHRERYGRTMSKHIGGVDATGGRISTAGSGVALL